MDEIAPKIERGLSMRPAFLTIYIAFILLTLSSCQIVKQEDEDGPILSITHAPVINVGNKDSYKLKGSCTGVGEDAEIQVKVGPAKAQSVKCVNFEWEVEKDCSLIVDGEEVEIVVTEGLRGNSSHRHQRQHAPRSECCESTSHCWGQSANLCSFGNLFGGGPKGVHQHRYSQNNAGGLSRWPMATYWL